MCHEFVAFMVAPPTTTAAKHNVASAFRWEACLLYLFFCCFLRCWHKLYNAYCSCSIVVNFIHEITHVLFKQRLLSCPCPLQLCTSHLAFPVISHLRLTLTNRLSFPPFGISDFSFTYNQFWILVMCIWHSGHSALQTPIQLSSVQHTGLHPSFLDCLTM